MLISMSNVENNRCVDFIWNMILVRENYDVMHAYKVFVHALMMLVEWSIIHYD